MFVAAISRAEGSLPAAEKAITAKSNFLYLAHSPVHSNVTIRMMMHKLNIFEQAKQVFIDLGVRHREKGCYPPYAYTKMAQPIEF